MEHELQLTARGLAVCELMRSHGLTLEAACERVEHELQALHEKVARILTDRPWEDVPSALQLAQAGLSEHVQRAYLEEQRRRAAGSSASLSA